MSLLTKSLYKDGRECPKRAWLGAHHRDWAKAPSEADRARMEEGKAIGKFARRSFPGGIDCQIPGTDEENVAQTAYLLSQGGDVFFEASFLVDGRFVRTDILVREGDAWRIVEVKSSGSIKPEHLEDVTFQWLVLEAAGMTISGVEIMHVNREWRSGAGFDVFLVRDDVTEECRKIKEKTADHGARLIHVLEQLSPPEVALNTFCKECMYFERCQPPPVPDDIVFLPGIRRDMVSKLRAQGVSRIVDIPDTFRWNERQKRVKESFEFSRSVVDPSLRSRLKEITFPAAFIDFEASMWAQPPWPGLRAYETIPFQWSLHWLYEDGTTLHKEYLAAGDRDPREEFAATLHSHLKHAASVVFYSDYETQRIGDLVKNGIPWGEELLEIMRCSGVDILKIVQDCVYLQGFNGSFSIKNVLPALVNDLSYKTLQVQNGDMAVVEFKRLASEALTDDRREEVRNALLEYCKLDTLAMVRIFERLNQLAATESR